MDAPLDYFLTYKPWVTLLLIVLIVVFWRKFVGVFADRLIKNEGRSDKRANMELSLNVVKWIVAIVMFAIILQVNDVDVPGIVAGLGIAGIVVGFALQDILKDLIMGASIVWDGYFTVGDVVRFQNFEGTVVSFNFKSTKINDINTGNIVTISNRNISEIEVLSDWCILNVPLPYDLGIGEARKAVDEIVSRIGKLDNVKWVAARGIREFGDSAIYQLVNAHCEKIEERYTTLRQMRDITCEVLEERGIAIPYNQLDVHMK